MMTSNSPLTIEIEGQRFQCSPAEWKELDCIEITPDEYHLLENGMSHRITILEFNLPQRTCMLQVDGEIKHVRLLRDLDLLIERMGLNTVQDKKLSVLNAPMPGLVSAIKVTTGQEVQKGNPMLILEAMKMENVITAPQQGTIKKINVTRGQAVEKGDVLFEFE